eukprot:scaffold82299_cov25-Cyclotella_meneghiniana.AAC.2
MAPLWFGISLWLWWAGSLHFGSGREDSGSHFGEHNGRQTLFSAQNEPQSLCSDAFTMARVSVTAFWLRWRVIRSRRRSFICRIRCGCSVESDCHGRAVAAVAMLRVGGGIAGREAGRCNTMVCAAHLLSRRA